MEDIKRYESKATAIFMGIMAVIVLSGLGLLIIEGLRCGR